MGSLSPLGRSGVCWNPGLAGDSLSLCSQASPGAAWGRTLAHGALIPSPVQCWAVEPCEVSAGAWLRLGSSQPAPRAARPPEGEAERRRGGPTVRGGAGGGGPGAGPSRAGPGRLGGAGPAGGGGRVVRTTDRLLVSGAPPSAASPAQGTRPGRARDKVTATVTWGRPAGSRAASGTRKCSGKSRAGTGLKACGSGARAGVRRPLVPSTSHSPHQRPGCVSRGAPVLLGEGNPFHCELAAWLPGPSGRTRGRTEPNVSPAPRGHATYTCGLITLPNPAAGSPEPSTRPLVTQRGAEHTGGSSSAPRGSSSAPPRRRRRDWAAAAGPPVSPRRPASPRPDPAGLPARAAGTSSPQCPGGHPGARPGGGEPGDTGRAGGGVLGRGEGKTPWSREGQAPRWTPGWRGGGPWTRGRGSSPGSGSQVLSAGARGQRRRGWSAALPHPAPSCPFGGAPQCVSTPSVEAARPGARLWARVPRAPLPAPPARSRRPPRAELCDVRRPAGRVTRGADPARGGGRAGTRSMEPRAGCRLPVRVEQVVNGALLVTVSCGERSFAGILLDCTKK